ncbi:DUF1206 domain-containing protein [Mumia sp. zg.B17]|uniref:DUF1206 domain-containing protein n=1 Tax=Mumia sp. zg.B17 TaxID=2855446 RepID=UPI001C6EBD12|nr:DUF1206 domain-containing protein [Mumia sp. zg.B17]MBW9206874.1 DUF1206 domain-containing protein [Mumia sp. zg.B17]
MTSNTKQAGRGVRNSKALETGAKIGLIAYGIVHLLIAWIAIQVAVGGGGEASQGGAMKTLSDDPVGVVILWITAVGFVALIFWKLSDAIFGFQDEDGTKKIVKKVEAAALAVLYGFLAVLAFKSASGSGGGGGNSEEGFTAQVMSAPAGRWLVGLIGLAIMAAGAYQIYRGVTRRFEHDLKPQATSGSSGTALVRLGQVGYTAKGIALGIVGLLFIIAAIDYDADKAGGLDDALKTLRDQPFGPVLLILVALGLAAFGAYCFGWARYVKRR